jgi:hypothetical protein
MNPVPQQNSRASETALRWHPTLPEASASPAIPSRFGTIPALRNEWLALGAACGPFEWIALGYLALSSVLIAIFADNLAHPIRLLATRACVVSLIILLCRGTDILAGCKSSLTTFTQKFWHFWRHWYPHLFFLFCFEELAHLVQLL